MLAKPICNGIVVANAVLLSVTLAFAAGRATRAFASTMPSSQPSTKTPLRWIAKDGAPMRVQHFLDSIPECRDAYIRSIQSNIAELKSQIEKMKQEKSAAAATHVPVNTTYQGGTETDTNAEAALHNQGVALTEEIERKWKEVHADEAQIAAASDPLWLPPPDMPVESRELPYEPLPANLMDYLVKVPIGASAPPAPQGGPPTSPDDPNCLTLADPAWTVAGTAPIQVLRMGIKGTALQLKVVGDGIRTDSEDAAHLTLKSQRRSLGLGEPIIAPVAKFSLEKGKLNVQWLRQDGEPGAIKALQYGLLETTDSSGAVVGTFRFSSRVDATLDCGRDGITKLALTPAVINAMNWTADGIPAGWALDKVPATAPAIFKGIALKADNASLRISYDSMTGSVVLTRTDQLQQRFDAVRQQLMKAEQAQRSPGGGIGGNANNSASIASLQTEMLTLQRELSANRQHWRALSSCAVSIVLPNGLDVARFNLTDSNAGGAQPGLPPLDPTREYPVSILSQYPDDQRLAYFRGHARFRQGQEQPGGQPADLPPLNQNNSNPGTTGSETYAEARLPQVRGRT